MYQIVLGERYTSTIVGPPSTKLSGSAHAIGRSVDRHSESYKACSNTKNYTNIRTFNSLHVPQQNCKLCVCKFVRLRDFHKLMTQLSSSYTTIV